MAAEFFVAATADAVNAKFKAAQINAMNGYAYTMVGSSSVNRNDIASYAEKAVVEATSGTGNMVRCGN